MPIKNIAKEYGIFLVLIALMVFFACASPVFMTSKNLFTIARQVSMTEIASVGMMFVILTGGIDLSIGSMVSLVNVIAAFFMVKNGWNPWLACLFVLGIMLVVGFIQGLFVSKVKVPPFIVTLAFMKILSGCAFLISNALPISKFPADFLTIGQGFVGIVPVPVIIMIVILIIGWFIVNKTYIGRYFYAIGGNKEASKLSGINVDRSLIQVYVFSALFATLAGLVMLSRLNVGLPNNGDGFEFEAITAVVLGGVSIAGGSGKLSGVIAGALIIGVLENGMILLSINNYIQMVVIGCILLIAVCFDCIQKTRITSNKKISIPEKAPDVK